MTIKEKGYTHWDGEFSNKKFPWWPITRYGIKLTFRRKFFKLLFVLALAPAFLFLAGIYVSERLEDFRFMIQEDTQFLSIDLNCFVDDFSVRSFNRNQMAVKTGASHYHSDALTVYLNLGFNFTGGCLDDKWL